MLPGSPVPVYSCIAVTAGRVYGPGYGTGRVYREGYTGCTTQPPSAREEVPIPAERAPEVPCRGTGVGGDGDWTRDPAAVPEPTPAGPVGDPWSPPWFWALIAASWPIGRDSTSNSIKLVKMTKCRPKSVKRPVIVPVCQNGSESRLLIF